MSWVKGYLIPFKCTPCRTDTPKVYPKSIEEALDFEKSINKLLEVNAISRCTHEVGEFISSVFLVPKPNGDKRFKLNLKCLNKFVDNKHFKMEDYRTASKLITQNCYMASVDLKDAYFLLPIHNSHKKYLRFIYNDVLYEFNCLPFGLCTAPYVFTKLLKPVMEYLRLNGFISVIYIDDIFLIGNTFLECKNNVEATIKLLKDLGFLINMEKSSLKPHTQCKFLGFEYDSVNMQIKLPHNKILKIKDCINKFLKLKGCKLREFARFIGILISACPAVQYSWLYTKSMEKFKYHCLLKNPSYDQVVQLPSCLKIDMFWWLNHIDHSSNPLVCGNYDLEIFSDASSTGWGAYCNTKKCFGHWTPSEKSLHINELELKAAFLALKCFAKHKCNINILLRLDNVTAICCINKMGSVQFNHFDVIAREIWQWCETRKITVFAGYINTKDNVEADQSSRKKFQDTEWEINNAVYDKITSIFGIPEIDLFASRCNAKCSNYVTWTHDPDALARDAFTISWKKQFFYAFPPFSMITKVMQKIISEKAEGIVIVPYWPTQPWFPIFKKLVCSEQIYFGPSDDLLICPFRSRHNLHRSLILVAAKLSGKHY